MQVLDTKAEKEEGIVGDCEQVCCNCLKEPAVIFQVTGEFCLECWQAVTHTNA